MEISHFIFTILKWIDTADDLQVDIMTLFKILLLLLYTKFYILMLYSVYFISREYVLFSLT